jgi:hypothetical protein
LFPAFFVSLDGSFLFSQGCQSAYPVDFYSKKVDIELDGKAEEDLWQRSFDLSGFSLPWEHRQAPATSFRAVADPENLYFFFQAHDETPLSLQGSQEDFVARGDRVEIFFALDAELTRYFCLEISPSSLVLDYAASYYRKFDREWDLPGLRVTAIESAQGFAVEGSIPVASLMQLGFPEPRPGPWIRVGLFRADFRERPPGVEENWISWCLPGGARPDFHVPSAFGFFRLIPAQSG